jgi:hypothetical protein
MENGKVTLFAVCKLPGPRVRLLGFWMSRQVKYRNDTIPDHLVATSLLERYGLDERCRSAVLGFDGYF